MPYRQHYTLAQIEAETKKTDVHAALRVAASQGNLKMVEDLVRAHNADPTQISTKGFNALEWAFMFKHTNVVHFLINFTRCDAPIRRLVNECTVSGPITPLVLLVHLIDTKKEDDVTILTERYQVNKELAQLAMERRDQSLMDYRNRVDLICDQRLLMQGPADVEKEMEIYASHYECIADLLPSYEAKSSNPVKPTSAQQAKGGDPLVVQQSSALKARKDLKTILEGTGKKDKDTALRAAACTGDLEMVEDLVRHYNADPTKKGAQPFNALDWAFKKNHPAVVQFLLEQTKCDSPLRRMYNYYACVRPITPLTLLAHAIKTNNQEDITLLTDVYCVDAARVKRSIELRDKAFLRFQSVVGSAFYQTLSMLDQIDGTKPEAKKREEVYTLYKDSLSKALLQDRKQRQDQHTRQSARMINFVEELLREAQRIHGYGSSSPSFKH